MAPCGGRGPDAQSALTPLPVQGRSWLLPKVIQSEAALVGVLAVFMAVLSAPSWLGSGKIEDFEKEAIRQAEIARKVAIAEAAAEARRRGVAFVPPEDYDR